MSIAYTGKTTALDTPTEPLRFPPATPTEELAQTARGIDFTPLLLTLRAAIEAGAVLVLIWLIWTVAPTIRTDGDAVHLAIVCGALLTLVFWRWGR